MLRINTQSLSVKLDESRIVGVIPTDIANNLLEIKRMDLIKLAKETNRYENKVTSGISVIGINSDDLLSGSTHLDIKFSINGHESTIRFENFMKILKESYDKLLSKSKSYQLSKSQMKSAITRAVYLALDSSDIRILCTCPDFTYRFAYTATVGNYKLGAPENRPASKTNPNNKGSMCKHLSSVIGVVSRWQKRVVSDIYKLVTYNSKLIESEVK